VATLASLDRRRTGAFRIPGLALVLALSPLGGCKPKEEPEDETELAAK
jgi:hypothetical protein